MKRTLIACALFASLSGCILLAALPGCVTAAAGVAVLGVLATGGTAALASYCAATVDPGARERAGCPVIEE
jgi:hypothetical protein